ncbi:hypothetical protein HNV12_01195 [Methanococcoides sp. SA1]|nr:hypothetical protein [Methanococcoides sp. SA1]
MEDNFNGQVFGKYRSPLSQLGIGNGIFIPDRDSCFSLLGNLWLVNERLSSLSPKSGFANREFCGKRLNFFYEEMGRTVFSMLKDEVISENEEEYGFSIEKPNSLMNNEVIEGYNLGVSLEGGFIKSWVETYSGMINNSTKAEIRYNSTNPEKLKNEEKLFLLKGRLWASDSTLEIASKLK